MGRTNARSILRVGLAAVRKAPSVDERLETVNRLLGEAAAQGAAIVCFPEAYIPGLRGFDLARATGLCARRCTPAFHPPV